LVAVFVITLGLVAVLGGLATASRAVARQRERVRTLIMERNAASGVPAAGFDGQAGR
jgi:Tfp pilus assembly protein PilV